MPVPTWIRLWRNTHVAPWCMSVPISVTEPGSTESAARLATPDELNVAPSPAVLVQPCPGRGGLLHTQVMTPSKPGRQNGVPGDGVPAVAAEEAPARNVETRSAQSERRTSRVMVRF